MYRINTGYQICRYGVKNRFVVCHFNIMETILFKPMYTMKWILLNGTVHINSYVGFRV